MACRLFGAKPLPEPMLAYCELDSWEQISVKFEWEFYHFHSKSCIWKSRLPKWRPFCPGEMNLRDPMWPGHEDIANSNKYFFLIICCTSQSLSFSYWIYLRKYKKIFTSSIIYQNCYGKGISIHLLEDKDLFILHSQCHDCWCPVASFTNEVNPWLAKCPLIFNGHLANCELTSLVKEATGVSRSQSISSSGIDLVT